jgi:hypothetical protein
MGPTNPMAWPPLSHSSSRSTQDTQSSGMNPNCSSPLMVPHGHHPYQFQDASIPGRMLSLASSQDLGLQGRMPSPASSQTLGSQARMLSPASSQDIIMSGQMLSPASSQDLHKSGRMLPPIPSESPEWWAAPEMMPPLDTSITMMAELGLSQSAGASASPVLQDDYSTRRSSVASNPEVAEWHEKVRTEVSMRSYVAAAPITEDDITEEESPE